MVTLGEMARISWLVRRGRPEHPPLANVLDILRDCGMDLCRDVRESDIPNLAAAFYNPYVWREPSEPREYLTDA